MVQRHTGTALPLPTATLTTRRLSTHSLPRPQILRRSGTERQKKLAQRIHPLLARPHVLLVTLLVCNAMAAEALPLVLDRLADPVTAVLVSVTVVLLFGE